MLPTGSGKSLCFQVPSLALPGPTLVLFPLLSLMADQAGKLAAAGVPVDVLKGGLTVREKEGIFERIKKGAVRLLLATPESCLVPANQEAIAACGFSHLVVDEAHCVSEWGESFRPSYLRLGELADRLGVPLITAFTATASEAVLEKVKTILFAGRETRVVATPPDRPNIHYGVERALCRFHVIARLIRAEEGATIVFFRTRKGTELAARTLAERIRGREIFFYHAGLGKDERACVEGWFLKSPNGVLCATTAYGMGVDKPDIRAVIHADVPPSIEAYLQETGRAGRDGLPARAILIVSREDGRFIDTLQEGVEKQRYKAMHGYALSFGGCRRRFLLSLIGQEAPACSGCDVCDGTGKAEPEGRTEILSFVKSHARKFRLKETVDILKGAAGFRVARGFLDHIKGFGLLSSWEKEDIEEAVETLIAEGALHEPKRGPWKGRLSV